MNIFKIEKNGGCYNIYKAYRQGGIIISWDFVTCVAYNFHAFGYIQNHNGREFDPKTDKVSWMANYLSR